MNERHDAIPLRGGHSHWVECTCGWVSGCYGRQLGAVVEHANHVIAMKELPRGIE